MKKFEQYRGTGNYIASRALQNDVNVAIALGRPLLIKGEPGTGKTLLASSIAEGLGTELLVWTIKSTTKAQDGLYILIPFSALTTPVLAIMTSPISNIISNMGN